MCRFDDPVHQSYRLDRLRHALEIDPEHPALLIYCAKLLFTLDPKSNGKLIALCREVVDKAMLSAESPAELFLVVGTAAAQKGEFEAAGRYLRVAYDKGDRSSAALNNLAWVIEQTKDGDNAFALTLVNEALAIDADSCDALSTRAEILISLGRYKDAIVDLERLVQIQGASTQLAGQLATLYDRVGDSETAAGYRRFKQPSSNLQP